MRILEYNKNIKRHHVFKFIIGFLLLFMLRCGESTYDIKIALISPGEGNYESQAMEEGIERALHYARSIKLFREYNLSYDVYPTLGDTSRIISKAMKAIGDPEVLSLIGESTYENSNILRLIANYEKMPHMQTIPPFRDEVLDPINQPFSLSVYPSNSYQAYSMIEFIMKMGWDKIAILASNEHLEASNFFANLAVENHISIIIQSTFTRRSSTDLKMHLKAVSQANIRIIVLFTNVEDALEIIDYSSKLSYGHEYVIIGNDALIELQKNYSSLGFNFTLFVPSVTTDLSSYSYDATLMLIHALNSLMETMEFSRREIYNSNNSTSIKDGELRVIDFTSPSSEGRYNGQSVVMRNLLQSSFHGETGYVSFDPISKERLSSYNILRWENGYGFDKIGYWDHRRNNLTLSRPAFDGPIPPSCRRKYYIGSLFESNVELVSQLMEAEKLALKDLEDSSPDYFFGSEVVLLFQDIPTEQLGKSVLACYNLISQQVIGVIGSSTSDSSSLSQLVLQNYHIPQVSPSSTSPLLSDKFKFPYFLRTIPSDEYQGRALAQICKHFNWDRVGAIASNDMYGSSGIAKFLEECNLLNITVTYQSVTAKDVTGPVAALKASNNKIFIMFTSGTYIDILIEAKKQGLIGPGYVWFGSDYFASTNEIKFREEFGVDDYLGIVSGSIGLRPILGIGQTWDRVKHKMRNVSISEDPEKTNVLNAYVGYAYDAALVMGTSIHNLLARGQDPKNGTLLHQELLSLNINGSTGFIEFSEKGDRIGAYELVNWRENSTSWDHIGYWTVDSGLVINNDIIWSGNVDVIPLAVPPPCALGHYSTFKNQSYMCMPCKKGFYTPFVGSGCLKTPQGTYTDYDGAPTFKVCDPGYYQSEEGSSKCNQCRPGEYTKSSKQDICELCEPGTYANNNGSSFCSFCPAGTYTSTTGSTYCNSCPPSTSTSYPGASSIRYCDCVRGNYRKGEGSPCVPCPPGGICKGGSSLPEADKGFWSSHERPYEFLVCVNENACPGGIPGTCHESFEGRLCAHCSGNSYQHNGMCHECTTRSKLGIGFGILVLITICVVINLTANYRADSNNDLLEIGTSLAIVFNFLQVLAILSLFHFTWPDPIYSAMQYLRYLIGDIDFLVDPFCSIGYSYYQFYYLRVFAPIFFLLTILFTYIIVKLHSFIVINLKLKQYFENKFPSCCIPPIKQTMKSSFKLLIGKMFTRVYTSFDCYAIVNSSLMFLDLMYIYMVSTSFEIFRCISQNDGSKTLLLDPSISCYEGLWYHLLPLSVIVSAVYGVGIPLLFGCILFKYKCKGFEEDKAKKMFSYLLCRWNPNASYWQMVLMGRKFLLSFVISTFATTLDVQFVGSLTVLYISLFIHEYKKPYYAKQHNLLEYWVLQICLIFLVICLLLNIHINYHEIEIALSYIMLLFIFMVICTVIWSVLKSVRSYRNSRAKRETLPSVNKNTINISGSNSSDTILIQPQQIEQDDIQLEEKFRNKPPKKKMTKNKKKVELRTLDEVELPEIISNRNSNSRINPTTNNSLIFN